MKKNSRFLYQTTHRFGVLASNQSFSDRKTLSSTANLIKSILGFRYLLLFVFFLTFFNPVRCHATGLAITNVSLEDRNQAAKTAVVEFDLQWFYAWNTVSNGKDAVWIFIKLCKDDGSGGCVDDRWYHCPMYTAGTNPADTDDGNGTDLEIIVPSDKAGAILTHASGQYGSAFTVDSENVRLTCDWGSSAVSLSATDEITAKVFGIEMVDIPEGDYYLGDGNGSTESQDAFHSGTSNSKVSISSSLQGDIRVDTNTYDDTQIENTGIGIDGDGGLDKDDNGSIDNANFPTGYTEFYLMKFELTQGQYRDFLNTLSQAEQARRVASTSRITAESASGYFVMTDSTSVTKRQVVKAGSNPADGEPYTFGCDLDDDGTLDESADGEHIAMNYLTWMDSMAYADWAGLRPMTELEFEKAARGTDTTISVGEFPWGSTIIFPAGGTIDNAGTSSEAPSSVGNGLCNYAYSPTGPAAPLRVGFGTTSTTDRDDIGAGFYGNVELSGNVFDIAVTVGNSTGRNFDGTHGDGEIQHSGSYEGDATCSSTSTIWPGCDTVNKVVTGATGGGVRGGALNYGSSIYCRVSDRNYASYSTGLASRSYYYGARFARTP